MCKFHEVLLYQHTEARQMTNKDSEGASAPTVASSLCEGSPLWHKRLVVVASVKATTWENTTEQASRKRAEPLKETPFFPGSQSLS